MNWGVILVGIFVAASAARDVFFGAVFQRARFFEVVLVAFAMASAIFVSYIAIRRPGQIRAAARAWRECAWVNVGTAAAWLSYFFALKLLEPAVVHTIHIGIGAVTLVALNAVGIRLSRPAPVRRAEQMLQGAIFIVLLALSAVVLMGYSGLSGRPAVENVTGLALAFASGIFISITSDVTKRMNDLGIGPETVLAVRFFAVIAVAAVALAFESGDGAATDWRALGIVAMAALTLIVLPIYALQLGLARTSAITAWVIMALGPGPVFAAQLWDGRLGASPHTLACITLYSALVIAASLARRYGAKPA